MPIRPLNILIAEDKASVADSLSMMLRRDGHQVEMAPDGVQAFSKLASKPARFDLLITDNNMPRMDGADLVYKLRETGNPIKVIVLTAVLTYDLVKKYKALGVDHAVDKPFDFSPLRLAIAEITEAIDAPKS
jgi:CheY-like chemotaxis protein